MTAWVDRKVTHIRPVALILAPSTAGKSHFVNTHPGLPVVDGDCIVTESIGWPIHDKEHPWWRTPLADVVHSQNWTAVRSYLATTGLVGIWNGGIEFRENLLVVSVIPPTAELDNYALERARKEPWRHGVKEADRDTNIRAIRQVVTDKRNEYTNFLTAVRAIWRAFGGEPLKTHDTREDLDMLENRGMRRRERATRWGIPERMMLED